MSSIPPVATSAVPIATSVGIDVLKKSENAQMTAAAQLLASLDPSQTATTTTSSTGADSATFSPAALVQLGLSQTGLSMLSSS
jgi:hypothetical protein